MIMMAPPFVKAVASAVTMPRGSLRPWAAVDNTSSRVCARPTAATGRCHVDALTPLAPGGAAVAAAVFPASSAPKAVDFDFGPADRRPYHGVANTKHDLTVVGPGSFEGPGAIAGVQKATCRGRGRTGGRRRGGLGGTADLQGGGSRGTKTLRSISCLGHSYGGGGGVGDHAVGGRSPQQRVQLLEGVKQLDHAVWRGPSLFHPGVVPLAGGLLSTMEQPVHLLSVTLDGGRGSSPSPSFLDHLPAPPFLDHLATPSSSSSAACWVAPAAPAAALAAAPAAAPAAAVTPGQRGRGLFQTERDWSKRNGPIKMGGIRKVAAAAAAGGGPIFGPLKTWLVVQPPNIPPEVPPNVSPKEMPGTPAGVPAAAAAAAGGGPIVGPNFGPIFGPWKTWLVVQPPNIPPEVPPNVSPKEMPGTPAGVPEIRPPVEPVVPNPSVPEFPPGPKSPPEYPVPNPTPQPVPSPAPDVIPPPGPERPKPSPPPHTPRPSPLPDTPPVPPTPSPPPQVPPFPPTPTPPPNTPPFPPPQFPPTPVPPSIPHSPPMPGPPIPHTPPKPGSPEDTPRAPDLPGILI